MGQPLPQIEIPTSGQTGQKLGHPILTPGLKPGGSFSTFSRR